MGEVQLEILQTVIRERFGFPVEFGAGSIVYKETIAAPVIGVGHYEPLRHYSEVHLLLEPAPRGSGLQFESLCSEDVLDRNWQRLVMTHLEEKVHRGVLTGSPITDIKISLLTGRAMSNTPRAATSARPPTGLFGRACAKPKASCWSPGISSGWNCPPSMWAGL